MKMLMKTFALGILFTIALSTFAFADVAAAPMIITIGLIYLLIGAVIIIAVALIIKLIIKLSRKGK